jgi:hypothetical protein
MPFLECDRLSRRMAAAPKNPRTETHVLGPAGQSDPTVNLSVFRRHPSGGRAVAALRACPVPHPVLPANRPDERCEPSFGTPHRWGEEAVAFLARYGDEELELIRAFLRAGREFLAQHTARVKALPPRELAAPRLDEP